MKTWTLVLGMMLFAMTGMTFAEMQDMSQHQIAMKPAATVTHEGTGVIKKINLKDRKIKISHEAIPSLNWPAMTMWFVLKTPLPKNLKEGAEVRFEVKKAPRQKWLITHIERK